MATPMVVTGMTEAVKEVPWTPTAPPPPVVSAYSPVGRKRLPQRRLRRMSSTPQLGTPMGHVAPAPGPHRRVQSGGSPGRVQSAGDLSSPVSAAPTPRGTQRPTSMATFTRAVSHHSRRHGGLLLRISRLVLGGEDQEEDFGPMSPRVAERESDEFYSRRDYGANGREDKAWHRRLLRRVCRWGISHGSRLVLILLFYIMGVAVFTSIETRPCDEQPAPDVFRGTLGDCMDCTFVRYDEAAGRVMKEECTMAWTVVDAIYFSTVTVTTVGYGDMVPQTRSGRIFAFFWMLYGLCVVLSMISKLAEYVLQKAQERISQRKKAEAAARKWRRKRKRTLKKRLSIVGEGSDLDSASLPERQISGSSQQSLWLAAPGSKLSLRRPSITKAEARTSGSLDLRHLDLRSPPVRNPTVGPRERERTSAEDAHQRLHLGVIAQGPDILGNSAAPTSRNASDFELFGAASSSSCESLGMGSTIGREGLFRRVTESSTGSLTRSPVPRMTSLPRSYRDGGSPSHGGSAYDTLDARDVLGFHDREAEPPEPYEFRMLFAAAVYLGSLAMGAVFFYFSEGGSDVSFLDAVWWAFVTTNTIGYGDVTPKREASRLVAVFYILFAVALAAVSLTQINATHLEMLYDDKQRRLLRRRLDIHQILALDSTGQGVDKFSFVTGMLTVMEKITDEDVAIWSDRFDELDRVRDGRLDEHDLREFAADEQHLAAGPEPRAERRASVGPYVRFHARRIWEQVRSASPDSDAGRQSIAGSREAGKGTTAALACETPTSAGGDRHAHRGSGGFWGRIIGSASDLEAVPAEKDHGDRLRPHPSMLQMLESASESSRQSIRATRQKTVVSARLRKSSITSLQLSSEAPEPGSGVVQAARRGLEAADPQETKSGLQEEGENRV